MPQVNIDITQIIIALIGLLASLITYRLVPWIKANTTAKQRENINTMVRIAVFAAEQLYGSKSGQEKLKYVEDWLLARGIKVDRADIEACVQNYFSHDTEPDKE